MGDSKDEYLCADSWTIKEGVNLLAGQDVYTEDDIIKDGLPSEIRDFAINLEWHTLRAQKAGTLPILYEPHENNHLDNVLYRHVRPKEFITWAKQKGFPIPNELTVLLHDTPPTEPPAKPPTPKAAENPDRDHCREIATLIWKGDPSLPISRVAQALHDGDHVVGETCPWRKGKEAAPRTIETWIRDLAPGERRPGRPNNS